jgi:RNA polymerase sigma factor (sigma-70 family)
LDINELHNQARGGRDQAENRLFDRLTARFRYFTQQKIIDRQDADEIVQEALLTIAAKYKEMEFRVSFAAWAYQVLENKILGYYRQKHSRGKKVVSQEKEKGIEAKHTPDPELKRRLLICLRKISKVNTRHARVLNLHYQGYSVDEICRRLEVTKANLYSILSRVRSLLHLCLEKGL